MRWAMAVGLLAIVVVVGVLSSGRSGGDTGELVDRVEAGLEKFGVPQPLTNCMARRLEGSLDDKEVERLYDSPRGVEEGTGAVVANPKIEKALVKSGKVCVLTLEKSGRMSRKELLEALRGLGELS